MLSGLSVKTGSLSLSIYFAISGDETTMASTSPSFTCIIGPYCVARSLKQRNGGSEIWCRFPIIGSFFGPGGRFTQTGLDFFHLLMKKKIIVRGTIKFHGRRWESIFIFVEKEKI